MARPDGKPCEIVLEETAAMLLVREGFSVAALVGTVADDRIVVVVVAVVVVIPTVGLATGAEVVVEASGVGTVGALDPAGWAATNADVCAADKSTDSVRDTW